MTAHNEAVLDALHDAQKLAQELARSLEDNPEGNGRKHATSARSLLSRLYMLESQLLETPDD